MNIIIAILVICIPVVIIWVFTGISEKKSDFCPVSEDSKHEYGLCRTRYTNWSEMGYVYTFVFSCKHCIQQYQYEIGHKNIASHLMDSFNIKKADIMDIISRLKDDYAVDLIHEKGGKSE